MGIMVYSLLWVMQDFVHQPYDSVQSIPTPQCLKPETLTPKTVNSQPEQSNPKILSPNTLNLMSLFLEP